jgi:hypothetical protein
MSVTGTTRPFAYNPSLSPISGTTEYGDIVVGDINTDYSSNYGGLKWWGGPLETDYLGYVIGNARPSGQPVPPGVVGLGSVGFWRSKYHTDQSFLDLANYIGAKNGQPPFATTADAENWLQSNGYYTSFNLPTPTPTATSQSTVTPTPTPTSTMAFTPTPTPTVTSTQTQTPTPSITASQTVTPTITQTPTNTNTPSVTVTNSPTTTATPTPSITASQTLTPTTTTTPTPTQTPQFFLLFEDSSIATAENNDNIKIDVI